MPYYAPFCQSCNNASILQKICEKRKTWHITVVNSSQNVVRIRRKNDNRIRKKLQALFAPTTGILWISDQGRPYYPGRQ